MAESPRGLCFPTEWVEKSVAGPWGGEAEAPLGLGTRPQLALHWPRWHRAEEHRKGRAVAELGRIGRIGEGAREAPADRAGEGWQRVTGGGTHKPMVSAASWRGASTQCPGNRPKKPQVYRQRGQRGHIGRQVALHLRGWVIGASYFDQLKSVILERKPYKLGTTLGESLGKSHSAQHPSAGRTGLALALDRWHRRELMVPSAGYQHP